MTPVPPTIPDEIQEVVVESSTTITQTVTVDIATPSPKKKRVTRKKKKISSDEESSEDEVDPSKYGRAAFSHKNKTLQPGKIDFCRICSQRFTITAYTKSSPDGEGLLCHKCGAVEQNLPKRSLGRGRGAVIGRELRR